MQPSEIKHISSNTHENFIFFLEYVVFNCIKENVAGHSSKVSKYTSRWLTNNNSLDLMQELAEFWNSANFSELVYDFLRDAFENTCVLWINLKLLILSINLPNSIHLQLVPCPLHTHEWIQHYPRLGMLKTFNATEYRVVIFVSRICLRILCERVGLSGLL